MAKMKQKPPSDSNRLLGEKLEHLRLCQDITRKQLGKRVGELEQQIARYEAGAYVPIAMLEKLMEALGEPVRKRLIRKISALRHTEKESGEEQPALSELYCEIFEDE